MGQKGVDEVTETETIPEVDMDGVTIVEQGNLALALAIPEAPEEGTERSANRKERRDYIRQQARFVRKAYGFGKARSAPGGVFIPPAVPR